MFWAARVTTSQKGAYIKPPSCRRPKPAWLANNTVTPNLVNYCKTHNSIFCFFLNPIKKINLFYHHNHYSQFLISTKLFSIWLKTLLLKRISLFSEVVALSLSCDSLLWLVDSLVWLLLKQPFCFLNPFPLMGFEFYCWNQLIELGTGLWHNILFRHGLFGVWYGWGWSSKVGTLFG